ncbi:hypothetical protein EOD42_20750 [Rhodovarius crocodyli]|uniref:SsuA/THI5-like domain-containing protein n=1 Tax=Rhodovarius crocodyli TaxID=1979269 RepID=A0A437M230_9PROT|nr:ABC transporter substrate-binding protein [Rhodovarius crocodyli]RVT91751.1 hypothetical protein EOD42_20750 [Rhodovarius crocodyli]
MTQRRSLLAAGAALAAGGLAAPALGQALAKSSFGPTTTDISTGHAAHSSLPRALGYWREEGLDVEVFGIAGNTAGLQLITNNNIDFISISGDQILMARNQGMAIKAVYMHARQPINRIVVPKAGGVTSIAQLKGKTLGIPVLGPQPYATAAFQEAGLDIEKDIRQVATGTGAPALLALRRGDIAGWISWDTAVAALENRGMEFTELRPSFFGDLFGNAIITREALLRENPALVVKMCRAIAKSVHFGLTNPEAAIRIHWQLYPQTRPQGGDPAQVMAEAKRVFLSRFSSYALEGVTKYGESLPSQWARLKQQMVAANELPADHDLNAAFDGSFIDRINEFDRDAVAAQARSWNG